MISLQGLNKNIALGGVVDMELAQQVAERYNTTDNLDDRMRSIDEDYGHLGPDFLNAVLNIYKPSGKVKPALQTPAPPQTPILPPPPPIRNFPMPTFTTTDTTDSNAKISLQTSNNSSVKVAPIVRDMTMEYSMPEVKPKTDEEAAKSTNKMWGWIAGGLAVLGIYAYSKKGKGLSGLGCACDDKPKPMAGVKTKKGYDRLKMLEKSDKSDKGKGGNSFYKRMSKEKTAKSKKLALKM
jgi:hypothetical protein